MVKYRRRSGAARCIPRTRKTTGTINSNSFLPGVCGIFAPKLVLASQNVHDQVTARVDGEAKMIKK